MHTGTPPDDSQEGRKLPEASRAVSVSALGLQVVLTFFVLVYAGVWIDGRYKSDPWGVLGGVALGIFAMFVALLREGGGIKSVADREREARERADDSEKREQ